MIKDKFTLTCEFILNQLQKGFELDTFGVKYYYAPYLEAVFKEMYKDVNKVKPVKKDTRPQYLKFFNKWTKKRSVVRCE